MKAYSKKEKAPYHFVPLNERVFYPQDFGACKDDEISLDKPFRNAQSGEISLKLIAKSDIFVGGDEKNSAQNVNSNTNLAKNSAQRPNSSQKQPEKITKDFFKIGDSYAISASSVRGVVRTIAEILSFAKCKTSVKDGKSKDGKVVKRRNYSPQERRLDMCERVFGEVLGDFALKGRVSVSHFMATKYQKPLHTAPSYTLMSPNLNSKNNQNKSGFKLYAPQQHPTKAQVVKNKNIITTIHPLGRGSEFVGKIRYFNLTKIELGLLLLSLSALKNEYFYKFGGAKPYGYGDTHIEFSLNTEQKAHFDECVKSYKEFLGQNGFEVDERLKALQTASKA
mgnify:FL=1